ncbi:phosphotransferase family protein [Parerythrobacter jejuensis]|uniref:Phosphotransferase n=1 Tax=Parerythrobacter jejuensis TaxID=795812 RepID=A0A845ARS8_9SPHN|nr:phosphotransferase [Parerythrobacter jejuensis]MXP32294.1 phosphotransferase [Parerythrobacter jejuensis]
MSEFPTHPAQISAGWLSEVLGQDVLAVRWEAIGTGQVGDSVRLHLELPEGSPLAPTLAAKLPAADQTSRATAGTFGLYAKEVGFYREIAPHLAVRVPEVYFSAIDDTGVDFVLLFEDLGPARGGNQIAGCSLPDAEAAMRQAAAIHAPSWRNAEVLDTGWLHSTAQLREQIRALYPQAQSVWRERYADALEPEYMELCEGVAAAGDALFSREPEVVSLVHGDFRLDNMLFDIKGGTEPLAILDWQTVTVGHAMTDIGYFMGCGIGELRAGNEDHLFDLYVEEMEARGVTLQREDVWRDYRIGALHGITTAVFSAAFVERTERGDANFLSMARGACSLALEHDSLDALKGDA